MSQSIDEKGTYDKALGRLMDADVPVSSHLTLLVTALSSVAEAPESCKQPCSVACSGRSEQRPASGQTARSSSEPC